MTLPENRLADADPISDERVSYGNTRQSNDGTRMSRVNSGPRKFGGGHDGNPPTEGDRNLWKDDFKK